MDLKTKLKQVEDDIAQAKIERADKEKALKAARDAFAATDGYDVESAEFKAAEAAMREYGTVGDRISELERAQVGMLKMVGQDANATVKDAQRETYKATGWNSDAIFTPDVMKSLTNISYSNAGFGRMEFGEVASRDVVKADLAGTTNSRRGDYAGAVPVMRRRLSVLDLVASGTMDANTVPYTQEGGTYAAAETAEGAAKPEAGVTLTDAEAVAKTIAHWKKIQKQSLSDNAFLRSIVDSHLRYGVYRRLEGQIVAGDGTGQNLLGIINTSGIQTQTFSAGALIADQMLRGITKVFLAEGEADGIAISPGDWQSVLIAKAQNAGGTVGSMEYLAGGPFGQVSQTLWGVPLVPTAALADGNALVGDFGMGAQYFVREGVKVLMTDSDQDDFIKNRVTMLGEGRFALAVWRPVAFVKVATA